MFGAVFPSGEGDLHICIQPRQGVLTYLHAPCVSRNLCPACHPLWVYSCVIEKISLWGEPLAWWVRCLRHVHPISECLDSSSPSTAASGLGGSRWWLHSWDPWLPTGETWNEGPLPPRGETWNERPLPSPAETWNEETWNKRPLPPPRETWNEGPLPPRGDLKWVWVPVFCLSKLRGILGNEPVGRRSLSLCFSHKRNAYF